ncbi:MIP/aquaporin family protein [Lactobacillus agrestimuris]|uniref:MIP/aquaporin family protein n=1 Tax=Lactobacillus agrestimuris TaxID=2941328 RepID=UPI0019B1C161|nr:MIP/aquaporin family protein [Lactobacillus agrestimuris]MBD5431333.1 aquaporin family protein [Lactobacillus sp.]
MEHTWIAKYIAEFFGTMILVLFGNGAVANSFLKGTTANPEDGKANGGWLLIAFGFGFGVMIPAMMFGSISGNHLNPAVTVAQAVGGVFPWSHVVQYLIAQMLGAIAGQLLIMAVYWPHIKESQNPNIVFACFATSDSTNSRLNGFVSEFIGTGVLLFAAVGLYRGMFFKQSVDIANIGVGFLITALVMAVGGPTGPALNPARDLGPRLVYSFLPIPNKSDAHWGYGWVPVVAPILGGIVGVLAYKLSFGL